MTNTGGKRVGRAVLCLVAAMVLLAVGACGAEPSTSSESPPPKGGASAEAEEPAPAPAEGVHACAGAGRWFPDNADQLGRLCDAYLSAPPPALEAPPVALIVPHAGYQFSGSTAGKAFALLKGRTYRRVILLGLSHQEPLRGVSVLRVGAYETPLGRIPVDTEAVDALLKCPVVTQQPAAHRTEHSVENQLPLLQRVLKDFKMVDMLVGNLAEAERAALADALRPLVDDQTLLVVSSDFTHYGPNYGYVPFRERIPENLQMLNNMAVQRIIMIDLPGWDRHLQETRDTICGRAGIGLLLKVVEPWPDIRAARVAAETSGHLTGDYTNSVTYAALVMWRGGEGLSPAEQQTLLRLARDTVTHFLKTGEGLKADPATYSLTPALKSNGAAFVTLKNAGQLRGCIGHIVAMMPLYECVIENACQACKDSRFVDNPITEKEAPALDLEISVLTPPRRVHDLEKGIVIGRDGLIMAQGRQRGVFLPQVPVEQGWNLEQYLVHLCGKAGLPPDAHKDPKTEIYRFSAQVFHEEKPGK